MDPSILINWSIFLTNGIDPNQTPRSAAPDLGLHYLPRSLLGYARHKWIKFAFAIYSFIIVLLILYHFHFKGLTKLIRRQYDQSSSVENFQNEFS